MAGIDSEVDMIKTAYGGNPQALNNKDIFHVLAARDLINDINAGANQLAASVQNDPNSVATQQEETLLNNSRAQMIAELSPGIQQKGQRSMQRQAMMGQQPMRQPMQGVAGIPANNMMRAAQGGIVGFNGTNGSQVKDSSFPDLSGDGKITRKDILIGSGVIDKKEGGVIGYAGPDGSSVEQTDSDDIDEFGGMNDLLTALMIAESGGDPTAVSRAGAEGAYQILPSTAADPGYGVPPMKGSRFDPEASREFAKQYLQAMLDRYDGDTEAALIAYNAGPGNADKFIDAGRDYEVLPQTMQTQPYVENIMGQLEKGVRQPSPGLIASRQTARKGLNFLRDARDFATGLFDETEATKERRKEQEEFNRKVRARNEGLGTLQVEDDVIETQEVMTPSGMTGDQLTAQLVAIDDPSPTGMTGDQLTAQLIAMDDPSPISYLQGLGIKQQARKDRFSNMFPGAQEAVDEYSKNKEMGGIGSLRQAGRMQEQQRKRDAEEARRAANYLLMQGRTNDMLTKLNPAMSFEDIEEVGIEGFAPGGDVEERRLGDGLGDAIEAGASSVLNYIKENPVDAASLGLMLVPGVGLAGRGLAALSKIPAIRNAVTGAGRLAQKAVTKPRMSGYGSAVRGPKGKFMSAKDAKAAGLRLNRQFDPLRTMGVTGAALGLGNSLLGGDDTEIEEVQDTTVEEIIRKTPPPPPPPKKSGLAGANIDFDMLRQQGAAAAGGTTTGQSLALAGAATGAEQARRETVAEKRRSDQERNAIYAEQVAATLAAGNQRRQAELIKAFTAYMETSNAAQQQLDAASLATLDGLNYDDLPESTQNQYVRQAALNFVQQAAGLGNVAGGIQETPELVAALAKYSGNPRQ